MARGAQYEEEIGALIDSARRDGVPWKVLCEEYELSRTRLYQLWRQWLKNRQK